MSYQNKNMLRDAKGKYIPQVLNDKTGEWEPLTVKHFRFNEEQRQQEWDERKSTIDQASSDASEAKQTATDTYDSLQDIIREQTEGGDLAPEVADARNGESTLGDKIRKTDEQLADTVIVPRYTYHPEMTYDRLIAQMREEINKPKQIKITQDSGGQRYFEVIRRIDTSGGDVTFRIETSRHKGTLQASNGRYDNVDFSGSSSLADADETEDGVWEKTIGSEHLTKDFIAFGLRVSSSEPSSTFAIIESLSLTQDGEELIDMDVMRHGAGITDGASNVEINSDIGYRYSLKGNGKISAPEIVYLSAEGYEEGEGQTPEEAITVNYFQDTFYPEYKGNTKYVILDNGIYKPRDLEDILYLTEDANVICPNGKAEFILGKEIPTSDWTSEDTDFSSMPYDPSDHYNASVRDGTSQPEITFLKTSTKTRKKFTKADSKEDCQNTNESYYYDFDEQTLYVKWADNDTYYISVPELRDGFKITSNRINATFANIDVISPERSAFRLMPSSKGDGMVYFYNCNGISSGTENDFHIDNYDSDLIECYSEFSGNDGFNFHGEGLSHLVNCEAYGAYNDGVSHHADCIGYVWDYRAEKNGTCASVPAFGGWVYHENCYSIDNGYDNERSYDGGYAVLGGSGYDETVAIYVNCKSVDDAKGFSGDIQSDSGGNKGLILTHNCEVENAEGTAYTTSNGAEIKALLSKGDTSSEGDNIRFIG